MKAALTRLALGLTVAAAVLLGGSVRYAPPASAKVVCHVLDEADWGIVTGQVSPYGGMYCHNH